MLNSITNHKSCIEPFVQYNGIETVLQIIENSNDFIILSFCIKILVNVIQENDEYKLILIDKKIEDLLKEKWSKIVNLEESSKSL